VPSEKGLSENALDALKPVVNVLPPDNRTPLISALVSPPETSDN
jgi:hypothetical protein